MGKFGKNKNRVCISTDGRPCPRCKQPTHVYEHEKITDHELRRPFYYSRWYKCVNPSCITTMIMPEQFKVLCGALPENRNIVWADDWKDVEEQSGKPPWED